MRINSLEPSHPLSFKPPLAELLPPPPVPTKIRMSISIIQSIVSNREFWINNAKIATVRVSFSLIGRAITSIYLRSLIVAGLIKTLSFLSQLSVAVKVFLVAAACLFYLCICFSCLSLVVFYIVDDYFRGNTNKFFLSILSFLFLDQCRLIAHSVKKEVAKRSELVEQHKHYNRLYQSCEDVEFIDLLDQVVERRSLKQELPLMSDSELSILSNGLKRLLKSSTHLKKIQHDLKSANGKSKIFPSLKNIKILEKASFELVSQRVRRTLRAFVKHEKIKKALIKRGLFDICYFSVPDCPVRLIDAKKIKAEVSLNGTLPIYDWKLLLPLISTGRAVPFTNLEGSCEKEFEIDLDPIDKTLDFMCSSISLILLEQVRKQENLEQVNA